jgi:hypothetical protein
METILGVKNFDANKLTVFVEIQKNVFGFNRNHSIGSAWPFTRKFDICGISLLIVLYLCWNFFHKMLWKDIAAVLFFKLSLISLFRMADVYSQLPSTRPYRPALVSDCMRLHILCGSNESEDSPNQLLLCRELPLSTVTFVLRPATVHFPLKKCTPLLKLVKPQCNNRRSGYYVPNRFR